MTLPRAPIQIKRRALPIDPDSLPAKLHPVLRRVLAARGIHGDDDLVFSLKGLHPPDALNGLPDACTLLQNAIKAQQRIVVVGDFDADGATGTALSLRALTAMGAADVHYVVPNRVTHGYGLTEALVTDALFPLQPDLIMTVDNGIASIKGVDAALSSGMRVIVTDHHLPGPVLPAADAIVNPNLPGDGFASKNLAGVGVAFYVMVALRARLEQSGWFRHAGIASPRAADWLDLVALGTVADLVPLDAHNRILVAQGLKRARAGRVCAGIKALCEVAGRDPATLSAQDFGFAVAPRLNAAGRLQDMGIGIECLKTDDPARARELAAKLDSINRDRRDLQRTMQAEAEDALAVANGRLDGFGGAWGVSIYDPGWHPGIVGLVAARLKDALHRPVIAFAPDKPGSESLKGSARSVPALHIRDTLAHLDAQEPGLITRFGGHAMAAGLSLNLDRLEHFEKAFDTHVRASLTDEDLNGVVLTDGVLGSEDFCLSLAKLLRNAAPWGQGFPAPCFEGRFTLHHRRSVGMGHLKLRVQAVDGGPLLDAISFNTSSDAVPDNVGQVDLVFELDVNRYQGTEAVQLRVESIAPVG